jgi:hypothetical protein
MDGSMANSAVAEGLRERLNTDISRFRIDTNKQKKTQQASNQSNQSTSNAHNLSEETQKPTLKFFSNYVWNIWFSVQLMDASDTLSLNEQIRAAQRGINETRRQLSNAVVAVGNLTAKQTTLRSRCEAANVYLGSSLPTVRIDITRRKIVFPNSECALYFADMTKATADAAKAEVQAQDTIEQREHDLFNTSVAAIDRDLLVRVRCFAINYALQI